MQKQYIQKLLKVGTLVGIFLATTLPSYAAYTLENWEIPSFHSDITINTNGNVSITENILADFTNESHAGIARSIPYEYTGTGFFNYNAKVDLISATNADGTSWNNTSSRGNGYLEIEMRTPDGSQLTKTADFIIKYTAKNVIGFFDETKAKEQNTSAHDEFYWNVNGLDWVVPIKEVAATIHLPKEISKENLMMDCFTGEYESKAQNCEAKIIDAKTIEFKTTQPLNAFENLTIVVGMPYGTIAQPSTLEKIWTIIIENWGIPFAILTLIIMVALWYKHGRDDQSVSNTIMPHYEPPKGMLPTEVGTLIDEKVDPKDITATIIDYAIKGYIQINEIEEKGLIFTSKDFELELLKPYITTKEYEKFILDGIFSNNEAGTKTKISDLANKFYIHVEKIQDSVMDQLVKEEYFPESPSKTRKRYTGVGFGIIFVVAIFGGYTYASMATYVGLVIAGLIIVGIGYKMPQKTRKGTETYYQLKGLYEYINTAEKDRMQFQEKNNIMFEKLLPYAMAFGLIGKWSKAFDGLIKNPPTWYHTNRPWGSNGFTMLYFADRLDHIGNNLTSNISSRPGGKGGGSWSGGSGFGGGGFSGGGFGGGGGHGL
jgi:uncharacterized membrane protein YgcG